MNLCDLQKEAHAIAKEHGWWDQERTFGDCIALVHSELSEALEAYRVRELVEWTRPGYWPPHLDSPPKPMGVASELADVVIRVADMAEWYKVGLSFYVDEAKPHPIQQRETRTFGDWISLLHFLLSNAFGRNDSPVVGSNVSSWAEPMGALVNSIQQMAAHYGIDLNAAIEAKMEYNRTREYRHGGKTL